MRRSIILLLSLIFSVVLFGQKHTFFQGIKPSLVVKNSGDQQLDIDITLGQVELSKLSYPSGNYVLIHSDLAYKTFGNGQPMLPTITRLMDIPANAQIKIKSINYQKVVIDLDKYFPGSYLLPSTPSQRKSSNPTLPTPDKKIYSTNTFLGKPLITTSVQGWLRSYHIAQLNIHPFQYNPVTNQLIIYTHIQAKIEFTNPDYTRTRQIKQRYTSPVFNFNKQLISTTTPTKALLHNLPIKLIIVYPDQFLTSALRQFKQWKERQGFDVVMAPTSKIGSDTTRIRSWLKNYYTTSSHPQDFVLFIGDVDKLPSWPQRTRDQHVSDLYYCEYTGDYLPEVYWGRISVDDTTELWNALHKILAYEQLNLPDTSYFNRTLLVAGNDENMEDNYGNGQLHYINTYYLNSNNGYEVHALYQDPPAGSSYIDTILDVINQGCALANYSAHCSPQGWSDPAFSQTKFKNGLTLNGLYGVWVANCCQSNKFDEEDAFSELALYTARKGVAAYIGASDYSYWDEDYWWAIGYTDHIVSNPQYNNTDEGAFDGYFHTHKNQTDPATWYITTAQMIYAGNMAVEKSTSDLKRYYWEIYQVMGDPTLVPFVGKPQKLVITPSSPVMKGSSQVSLQTSPYTYLTIYQSGMRIGLGLTNSQGQVTINTQHPISEDSLTVYAWGQNKIPAKTIINTISGTPIVQPQLLTLTANSGTADTLIFSFGNNTDTATLYDVYATFQVIDPGLNLSVDSVFLDSLPPNTTDTVKIPCTIGQARDLSTIRLLLKIHQRYDTSQLTLYSQKTLTIHSPELQILSISLQDQNHNQVMDANETGQILLKLCNRGHADLDSLDINLSISPSLATLTPTEIKNQSISSQDTLQVSFAFQCQDFSEVQPAQIKAIITTLATQDSITLNTYFGQPTYLLLSLGKDTITNYPLDNYWRHGETQILLTRDEIRFIPIIDEIALRIIKPTPNGDKFKNLKIGFYQDNIEQLQNFIDTSLFTTVFSQTVTIPDQVRWYYFHTSRWEVDDSKDLVIYIRWGDNGDYVSKSDAFGVAGENTSFTSVLYKNYDYVGAGSNNVYSSTIRPALKIGKGEISDLSSKPSLSVLTLYPNPTSGLVNLILPGSEHLTQIQIYSVGGVLMRTIHGNHTSIDLTGLKPGLYLLRITGQNQVYSAKIIKQ